MLVTPKTVKTWEGLAREQLLVASHLDLQLQTSQKLLLEQVLLLNKAIEVHPKDENLRQQRIILNKAILLHSAMGKAVGNVNNLGVAQLGNATMVRRDAQLTNTDKRIRQPLFTKLRHSPIGADNLFEPEALTENINAFSEILSKSMENARHNIPFRSKVKDSYKKRFQKKPRSTSNKESYADKMTRFAQQAKSTDAMRGSFAGRGGKSRGGRGRGKRGHKRGK